MKIRPLKIGSHVPFAKPDYLVGAAKISIEQGANALMIYLGPPQNTFRAPIEALKISEFMANYASQIHPNDIVVHAPYIINLASPSKSAFAIELLKSDIALMNALQTKFLVIHPGSSVETNPETAFKVLTSNLKKLLEVTKDVIILIETMAGKGKEMCVTLEQVKAVLDEVNDQRLGVCLDTCHLWEAGYNLNDEFDQFMNKLQKLDLISRVHVIHVNDSKNVCGARKDRHENLTKGFIKLETLQKFVHHDLFQNTIKILETPWVDGKMVYKEEIQLLKNPL